MKIIHRDLFLMVLLLLFSFCCFHSECWSQRASAKSDSETLPPWSEIKPGNSFEKMWHGFDPRREPLETEVLKEWKEEGVNLRIVRFRIGRFKGKVARLAAIYGYPDDLKSKGNSRVPGLVQIHGGGQYAHYQACLANAKRGYATVSIAWAGRISAPGYQVGPAEVKLFWENKTSDAGYRVTTDWGAVDGYHAPSRNQGNVFPSAKHGAWTLDDTESPRNSGWFLCALAARRAITFLEQQPEVDPERIGVYGHSMGGKLTVMASVDERVKAAAPSCGGISDRYNASKLFRQTVGDDPSLKQISCPIMFLSPANDFHGRIADLPAAVAEIKSNRWRVTCSPHHNHQDTPSYEVATLLWFDQHLKGNFKFPKTPETYVNLEVEDGVPQVRVTVDQSSPVQGVDVFYTQQGKSVELPSDMSNTIHRFWHSAVVRRVSVGVENKGVENKTGKWIAKLPLSTIQKPLWVYANVHYKLEEPVSGVGYYYGAYTANSFFLSSVLKKIDGSSLEKSGVRASRTPTTTIEDFQGDWRKEWFTYRPSEWPISTNKLHSDIWKAPSDAKLAFQVKSDQSNQLLVRIDDTIASVDLEGGTQWQAIELSLEDFKDYSDKPRSNWTDIKMLKLCFLERVRPPRGESGKPKLVGKRWQGKAPEFGNLRWVK